MYPRHCGFRRTRIWATVAEAALPRICRVGRPHYYFWSSAVADSAIDIIAPTDPHPVVI